MTDRPSGFWRFGVLVLLGAVLFLVYFGRYVPARRAIRELASPAAAGALVLLASLGIGFVSKRATRRVFAVAGAASLDGANPDLGHECLIGVPVFGTILGLIGSTPIPLRMASILLTLVLAGIGLLVLLRTRPWPRWSPTGADVALLGPPILVALMESITPVVSDDELVYKLALPHAYLLEGRIVEFPLQSNSYFPGALTLPSVSALALSGGIAAKLIFFGIFLLTLRVIYQFSGRIVPGKEAYLTAVAAWTPALLIPAGWCWPDWGMVGLLLLSYESWIRFRESRAAGDAAVLSLALAGALGGKYTGIPWLFAFLPLALFQMWRRGMPVVRLAGAAAAVLVVFGGFFYFRNLAWTGSPIAPFLLPDKPQIGNFGSSGPWESWKQLFQGKPIMDPGLGDDALGILLPLSALLSPLALAGTGRRFSDLFALSLLQFGVFVGFTPLWRYTFTALVPLALLGAGVCLRIDEESRWPLRAVLRVGASVALVGQLLLVLYLTLLKYDYMPYLLGQETEEHYLARKGYVRTVYSLINAKLPADSRIFMIGEDRPYYLDRLCLWAGNQDGPRLAHYLARFRDADSFDREMRRLGITDVLWNRQWYRVGSAGDSLSFLQREVSVVVDPATDNMLRTFFSTKTRRLYADKDYELYQLERLAGGPGPESKAP
ncbi:MAG TPA: hypothetical protein VF376_03335 [Thermoanaerobaculia bacterium]